jgi:hypothetical protein
LLAIEDELELPSCEDELPPPPLEEETPPPELLLGSASLPSLSLELEQLNVNAIASTRLAVSANLVCVLIVFSYFVKSFNF